MPEGDDLHAVPPRLRALGVGKRYGGVRVLGDVSFDVAPGTIHALLGENGAGKSTLIKTLSGVVSASEGGYELDGDEFRPRNVRDAEEHGVVTLPQELSVIPALTVAENILLGASLPRRAGVVRARELRRRAQELLDRLDSPLRPDALVADLSVSDRTIVALARALARNARLLVLDEPTAALTDHETERLFRVLEALRDAGVSILYVSHRLDEIFRICSHATVLRNGALVWTRSLAEEDTTSLAEAISGRSHDELYPRHRRVLGDELIAADSLVGGRIRDTSFSVRAGEVLGLGGLAGSGRTDLLRILCGAHRPRAGVVAVDGAPVPRLTVRRALRLGIVYVPEERRSQALFLRESITTNIAVASLRRLSRFGIIDSARTRRLARRQREELRIRSNGIQQPVSELSGGNQQKVVLARLLAREPRIILLEEPTKGIDLATRADIYAMIRALADAGAAIVLSSSDTAELMGLADRILLLRDGRIASVLDPDTASEGDLVRTLYQQKAA